MAGHPRLILIAAVALAGLALLPASGLTIVADLSSLLPEESPAARDYRRFLETFGGFEKVFVLVTPGAGETADAPLLAAAAAAMAEALSSSPTVERARAGEQPEDEAFFLQEVAARAALLAEPEAIGRRLQPEAVRDGIALWRERLTGPGGTALVPWMTADPLGLSSGLGRRRAGGLGFRIDPATGGFLSAAGDAALVIATPTGHEIDPASGRALQEALERAHGAARAVVPGGWEYAAVGGALYAAHDEAALRRDLSRTAAGSMIVVALLLLVTFGGLAVPAATLLSLGLGLAWTAGAVGLISGRLTAVGIGFTSILVGLGVDYGVHAGTRYRQGRLDGDSPEQALGSAFRDSGPGIAASAVTTAAGFGCLLFAGLLPLQEMGGVVALGILAILVATATGGAALLALATRRPPRGGGPVWIGLGTVASALPRLGLRRRRPVLLLAALLTVVAVWALADLLIDPDPRLLRPAADPLRRTELRLARAFGLGADTATVMVRGSDRAAALDAAARVAAQLRSSLPGGADLLSPSDWIIDGDRRARRAAELAVLPFGEAVAEARRALQAAGFRLEPFEPALRRLAELGQGRAPEAPPVDAWPAWLRELVQEDDQGATVALALRLPAGSWPEGPPPELLQAIDAVATGTAIASVPRVGVELREMAVSDVRRLGLVAALAVAGVVVLSFRGRVGRALQALLPVALGSAWTFGLWSLLGRPIDLFCLAAVPVMIGIGVDDGLHAVHRAVRPPGDALVLAVSETGRAMILTTLTTAAGFASLALSGVPALRNGGLLIATGVVACLLATLLVLPALERGRA